MKIIAMAGIIMAAITSVSASSAAPATTLFSLKAAVPNHAADARANRIVVLRVPSLGPGSAKAVVVRRPAGQSTQDFILVNASTSPADLAKAVATIMFSYRTQGVQVTRELRAEISPATTPVGLRSKELAARTRDLARLARARVVSIKGVGTGPAIGITTAKVAARQKQK